MLRKLYLLKLYCLLLLLTGGIFKADAQFETVYIGVNGLTCSQCTKSVEMQIRKLDFVADVQMNLEHTEGKVILKKNIKPDMDKIAQAVVNAGFSVRYLQADFVIDHSVTQTGACFKYMGDEYVFTDAQKDQLKGTVKLKFIGKKYLPKNEFKKVQALMDNKCGDVSGKVYHVAI
jgi:copper chaperone CopZ